ncbi:MAG: hypothetical protein JWL71_4846 [Acidobacteria bacterium]|nr:hypothetical protein [Acidobacteriota bacterium]
MSTASSDLRIGTSGWNYPTGQGTWNGIFYPPSRGRAKGFDELAFYAEHFDTVEVNSTFYGQPRAEVTRAWAARTPSGFEFSVKLYQKFTHPTMFKQRLSAGLPEGADAGPALLDALARPNEADIDAFRRGIDPLASSGRLGALLAQFPASFKDEPASRDYLVHLLGAFAGYPVAVELRHKSWSDRIVDTLTLLNAFGAAWVQIDEPKFRFSIRQNYLPNVEGFYYMRLHGRNAAQWWRHDKSEDRYNYLYSADELTEFSETAGAAQQLVKKLYLYTNNHFSAKSIANAAMIKRQLGQPLEGDYPPEFLERYPELTGAVKTAPASLLHVHPPD